MMFENMSIVSCGSLLSIDIIDISLIEKPAHRRNVDEHILFGTIGSRYGNSQRHFLHLNSSTLFIHRWNLSAKMLRESPLDC